MQDHYHTLAEPATGYFMNSGSKFYAHAYPVVSEEAASAVLAQLKKEHPKARHFCTAIRLQADGSFSRSSDDGEPAGSAGKPILGQLIRYDLTNVYVVVVRYFGGTKLGIPGLIEAYKTSTDDALRQASKVERFIFGKVQVTVPFDSYPGFLNHLLHHGHKVIDTDFASDVTITIALRKSQLEQTLLSLLSNFTQLDYTTVEEYEAKLNWKISLLPDDLVQ